MIFPPSARLVSAHSKGVVPMKEHAPEDNRVQRSDPRLILTLVVYGYAGLVLLAFWVDSKIHKHRLRKKRAQSDTTSSDHPHSGKEDPRGPKKR